MQRSLEESQLRASISLSCLMPSFQRLCMDVSSLVCVQASERASLGSRSVSGARSAGTAVQRQWLGFDYDSSSAPLEFFKLTSPQGHSLGSPQASQVTLVPCCKARVPCHGKGYLYSVHSQEYLSLGVFIDNQKAATVKARKAQTRVRPWDAPGCWWGKSQVSFFQ